MQRWWRLGAQLTVLITLATFTTFLAGVPAQAATSLGSLALVPATGQDITPITLNTVSSGSSKGCPAEATHVAGLVTGPGGWAAGINAVGSTEVNVSSTADFEIQMQDTFSSMASVNNLTVLVGKYTITINCQDALAVNVYGQFTASLWFIDATHYQSTDPNGPAPATPTTTTFSATPASGAVAGAAVTLVSAVAPAAATGTVQFTDTLGGTTANLGAPVTVTGGSASLTTTALSAATHSLKAVFTPANAAAYQPSTSAVLTYVVTAGPGEPVTPTLTLTGPASATAGASAAFALSITPAAAAGQVQLTDTFDGTSSDLGGPITLAAGAGSFSTADLAIGSHAVKAVYTPSDAGAYAPATAATVTVVVTPASTGATQTSTQLAAAPAVSVKVNTDVVLTATTTPANAVGSIQFSDVQAGTAVPFGAPVAVAGGAATVTTRFTAAGAHTLRAVFTPTNPAAFTPSTSTDLAYTVTPADDSQAKTTRTTLTGWTTGWCPKQKTKPIGVADQGGRSGSWHYRRCRGEVLVAQVRPGEAAGTVQFTDTTTGSTATPIGAPVPVSRGWAVLFVQLSSGRHTFAATFTPTDPAAFKPSTSNRVRTNVRPGGHFGH